MKPLKLLAFQIVTMTFGKLCSCNFFHLHWRKIAVTAKHGITSLTSWQLSAQLWCALIVHQLIPNDCLYVNKIWFIGLMSETVSSIYFCVTFPGFVPYVLKGKKSRFHFLSLVRCEYVINSEKLCRSRVRLYLQLPVQWSFFAQLN